MVDACVVPFAAGTDEFCICVKIPCVFWGAK